MNNMINFGIGILELLIVLTIVNVILKLFFRRTLIGRLLLECMKSIVALMRFTFRTVKYNLNNGIKYTRKVNDYINKQCNHEDTEENMENKVIKDKAVNENTCDMDNVIDIKKSSMKRKIINKV